MHISILTQTLRFNFFLNFVNIFPLFFCEVTADYHHEVLDRNNRFHLHWKIDKLKEKISFKIEVETRGYVALGFSPNGGMPGSDVAFGWVKNGKAHLQVRYTYIIFIIMKIVTLNCYFYG